MEWFEGLWLMPPFYFTDECGIGLLQQFCNGCEREMDNLKMLNQDGFLTLIFLEGIPHCKAQHVSA